jgi:membrane fusion protein (multidrug efflux system)
MSLEAPFTGVVGKGKAGTGDYVNVGQNLVTLTDTQHLRIEYSVPEKYVSGLKLGTVVKVTTAAYPGKIFTGKLAFIAPTITAENRSIALYADISNDDHALKPGMFVDVTQSLGVTEHAMMVPARTLVPILDGQQIYKVISGKVVATTVTIGSRVGDNVQILQGLSPGDEIITDGQIKVKNGMPVKIKS